MRATFPPAALLLLLQLAWPASLSAQVRPDLLTQTWPASWIAVPGASFSDFGVYHFRKQFDLASVPESLRVHVSADNRYQLYVNGRRVSEGPARGDLLHWRFETVDLAPFLHAGENQLAAVVWNFGEHVPFAQMTRRTGFILQSDLPEHRALNTSADWLALENQAYSPIPVSDLNTFVVVGPGEQVEGAEYPWEWQQLHYDDSTWPSARELERGLPRGIGSDMGYLLVPRRIPPLEHRWQRFPRVARSDLEILDQSFLEGAGDLVIPPGRRVRILLDQEVLTTAYPLLEVSGGRGSSVEIAYAEALVDEEGRKGHRDEIEGRVLVGIRDRFLPDGSDHRFFETLWWRTFRYVELRVHTSATPLIIHDFRSRFTAYPFQLRADFRSDQPSLREIWEVGWRTARLCAGETYFDCPYYEQLQYVGDTRIQALISLYLSGDDRLMRKAIELFDQSRLPLGLTQSRYPSEIPQVIPPYSLFWISMVYDHWMHRDDRAFIRGFMPGVRSVLHWYERHLAENRILGPMKWWNFVDWTDEWPWVEAEREGGVPRGARQGGSSILSFQFAYAARQAAALFEDFGESEWASHYRRVAAETTRATMEACWNAGRGLVADTPDQSVYSQHANIFAVLVDGFPSLQAREVMRRVLSETDLIQTSYYFRFYLFEALKKSGLADLYISELKPWHEMLDLGLTTFAEKPEPTRSDCHAWSAGPLYHFLSLVAGVEPAAPGFSEVRIEPFLGPLQEVSADVVHPHGLIRLQLRRSGLRGLEGTIELPRSLRGTLRWYGREQALAGGRHPITLIAQEGEN